MSDTPETDKIIQRNTWQDGSITELSAVHKDFARKLERERNELRKLILDFCEGQRWAVKTWKEQEHIKPLFDMAEKIKDNQ